VRKAALSRSPHPIRDPTTALCMVNCSMPSVAAAFDGDIYDVGCGFSRDEGKLAFQIALNAPHSHSAVAAIATDLGFDRPRAAALLDAVRKRNAPVADLFGRDLGVQLMRIDSDIILGCLANCFREGIPVLPVHDELVVPTRYGSRAAEIMVENFEARVTPVSPCQVRIKPQGFTSKVCAP
jgi:hypothetical protein